MTILVYDRLLTHDLEYNYIFKTHFTPLKIPYLLVRYYAPCLLIAILLGVSFLRVFGMVAVSEETISVRDSRYRSSIQSKWLLYDLTLSSNSMIRSM